MLVSVVVTSHNYARYLSRAIRSIYNQSMDSRDYEIIIVDDASKDETQEILKLFKDTTKIIELKKNVGLSEARNIGIRNSIGQYVVFVDADDYIHRDMLKVQETFLTENNKLDAVAVDYYTVIEQGDHIEHISSIEFPIACGIMFRKDLLIDIGLYDKKFKAREEEDLRFRFLKKYSIYNIILPLYRYRKHDSNLTNNKKKMKKFSDLLNKKHQK